MSAFDTVRAAAGVAVIVTVLGLVLLDVFVPGLSVPAGYVPNLVGFAGAVLLADRAAAGYGAGLLDRVSLTGEVSFSLGVTEDEEEDPERGR